MTTTIKSLPETRKTITESEVQRARGKLQVAGLEREIISYALTRVQDAETKGQLPEAEKAQLLQRYTAHRERVDSEIDECKRIVGLYELESARDELLKGVHEKLSEIDSQISQLRPSQPRGILQRLQKVTK